MPIAGLVRLRKHQFGRQTTFGTNVPAVQAHPFSGTPSVNLNWTDPEVDVGSIDPQASPIRTGSDLTAGLTDPGVYYNTLPRLLSGILGGDVDPTGAGAAKTWTFEPASTTLDEVDVHTYEFGDDVTDDWFQFGNGILESLEISGPEGLGPLTASMTWRFGSVRSTGSTDSPETGTVPTPDLNVEQAAAIVYLKDGAIYLTDDPTDFAGDPSSVKISDALHSFTLRISGDIDQKRYANGTQSFDIQEYARANRLIELECVFGKTDDIVGIGSESDAWMSDTAVNRYVMMRFVSTAVAQEVEGPDTFYSWTFAMPLRYYTRTEGESGGNSTVVLTGHAFYDPDDFEGVFTSTVVNTQATI